MKGTDLDILIYNFKKKRRSTHANIQFINTPFGRIRLLDTGGTKPVVINAPDLPNVIEHHENLISELAHNYRVVCLEFPGTGLSYPNYKYNYSIEDGANLLLSVINTLGIGSAALLLSCSNGLYGIRAAEMKPNKINHLFLSQTCSIDSLDLWSKKTIPKILTYPYIGQLSNLILRKRMVKTWYRYAPHTLNSELEAIGLKAIEEGACYCLSSLVQGMKKEKERIMKVIKTPSTLIWGEKDITHRKTNSNSILHHLPNCKIINFKNSGHFPELENTQEFVRIVNEGG